MDVADRVTSRDGTSIAFERVGAGPALILVDAAGNYRDFRPLRAPVERLAADFTVYLYDRRGRGDSADTPPYAIEREFEDLEAMIGAAGGSAYVWGLSSGGILALEAARAGVAIEKLAVYEPPFIVDRDDGVPPGDFRRHLDELIAADRRSDAAKYFMAKVMGMPAVIPLLMSLWPPLWSNLKATTHTLPYEAALVEKHQRGQPLERSYWAEVTTPTLVVCGEKSPKKLRKGARAIAAALPNAEARELKGVSHNVKMKVLAPVLVEFFAGAGRTDA